MFFIQAITHQTEFFLFFFSVLQPRKFSGTYKGSETGPHINRFCRNCSCISIYIIHVPAPKPAAKNQFQIYFWKATRSQKTGPTINSLCRNCFWNQPTTRATIHCQYMALKQRVIKVGEDPYLLKRKLASEKLHTVHEPEFSALVLLLLFFFLHFPFFLVFLSSSLELISPGEELPLILISPLY